MILGLDPGTNQSALVLFDGAKVAPLEILPNESVCDILRDPPEWLVRKGCAKPILVIEEFESYGMAVGREVFRTIRWAGNFEQAWKTEGGRVEFLPRRIIKQHICHTARATDANIRTELIDRFGGPEKAIGKKATPGPLYGIKSHCWAALAVAITFWDLNHDKPEEIRPGVQAEF